jgi:hypothetical protein
MNLTKTLKISLIFQIAMYILALVILYSSSHDGIDSYSGAFALVPLNVFSFLCLVNLILYVIYRVKVSDKKITKDKHITVLVVIVLLAILLYGFLSQWALSGKTGY